MMFDVADIASLETGGQLDEVILHEMAHVLGFGTLWNYGSWSFQQGTCSVDPYFDGSGAIAAFNAAGGSGRTGTKVPVENTGGSGTICSHWRETVHNTELMTGWLDGGVNNPLSAITIASFGDMGYTVDMGQAEAYTVHDPAAALRAPTDFSNKIFLHELPPPKPIFINPDGTIVRRE
jgi:hypothetical protein